MTMRLDYMKIAPGGIKALGGVYGYLMQSGLPADLVELVYLRISQINNCAYCLDMHTRDLLKSGVKIEKLVLLQAWAEAGNLFDEQRRNRRDTWLLITGFVALLAFIGFGSQPGSPDWGRTIYDERTSLLSNVWWPSMFPALALASLVVAINLVADSIQGIVDR